MISSAVCALTTLAFRLDAAPAGGDREDCRPGLMAVIPGDPDGDLVPAGRFVHAWHCMRGT
jgi:hypothetical protein